MTMLPPFQSVFCATVMTNHYLYFQGIEAVSYDYSGTLPGPGATMKVQVFFFKENGNISVCDEEESITHDNRTMKFNVDVSI